MNHSVPEVEVSQVSAAESPLHLLDVREDVEWAAGHIEGALHVPMMAVPSRLAEIPSEGKIVVVCRSGHRSARVTEFLIGQGRDAVNLAGGMHAWEGAGRSMTGAPGQTPQVI